MIAGVMAEVATIQQNAAILVQLPQYEDTTTYIEPKLTRVTCYLDVGHTYSGQYTRYGICAVAPQYVGSAIAIYEYSDGDIGQLIGIYEGVDTGKGIDTDGDGIGDSIQKGLSVDVWQANIADVEQWQKKYGDYLYIQIIPNVKG